MVKETRSHRSAMSCSYWITTLMMLIILCFSNLFLCEETPPSLAVKEDGRGLDDTTQSYICKSKGPSHSCVLSTNGISNSRLPNLLLVSSNKSYDKGLVYVLSGHLALFVPCYSVAWMCWHYLWLLISEHLNFFFFSSGLWQACCYEQCCVFSAHKHVYLGDVLGVELLDSGAYISSTF